MYMDNVHLVCAHVHDLLYMCALEKYRVISYGKYYYMYINPLQLIVAIARVAVR